MSERSDVGAEPPPQAGEWGSLLDPPYSVELLAELHANALDDELAAQLWPRVYADPDAGAILAALDTTVRALGELDVPPSPMPAHVAARIDDALAAASPPPRPVADLVAARARRIRRQTYAGIGAVAAAAVVAGVFVLSVDLGSHGVAGTPQAVGTTVGTPPAPAPLDLGSGAVGPQALAAVGRADLGPLSDKAVLAGCLQANGIAPESTVIGSSQVLLDGKRGTLLLLPTGRTAVFTALVVGPECSSTDPATRTRVEIGPR